ncbi:diaminopimelate decarboxylase [Elusimicrobiota bacterium]
MLNYINKRLFIERTSLGSLAKKFGTPLFVYSKNKLIENFISFDNAFSFVPHITCYATKANSNNAILKVLASLGAGADITSGGELFRSLKAGIPSKKIIYAGIGKTAEEISYALKHNILMFNVESVEELVQINNVARKLKKKASIAFRINPNVDPYTHHYITTGKKGGKFGVPYTEALNHYKIAKKMSNIHISGIHCHIGSQITYIDSFHMAAVRLKNLVDKLSSIGINLEYINMGGGLGIDYGNNKASNPVSLSQSILPVFRNFKGKFIFEPGRFIVGNAGIFLVKVIYRKKSGGKNFLIVDGAMNDLLRPTLYDAYHEILPETQSNRGKVKLDIVGPICESGDFLGKNRTLPWLDQNDLLAVTCTGAYGSAMSSQYNSRLRAPEIMVEGNKAKIIRKRETHSDLVNKEI